MAKMRYCSDTHSFYEVDENDNPVKTTPKRPGESRTRPKCKNGEKNNSYAFVGAEFGDGVPSAHKDVRYVCWAPEVTPTTNRKHTQFYIYFLHHKTKSAAFKWLKKHWGFTSPVDYAYGTPKENRGYCGFEAYDKVIKGVRKVKDVNPEAQEIGILPQQGVSKNLWQASAEIEEGAATVATLAREDPMLYHKYGRTLNFMEDLSLRERRRRWQTAGIWLHGRSRCGKSWFCEHVGISIDNAWWWCPDNGYYEGYTGQPVIVINEFRGELPFSTLLSLVDRVPFKMRRRSREPAPCLAELVIVTSSKPPWEVYGKIFKKEEERFDQIWNRFQISDTGALREVHLELQKKVNKVP